MKQNNTKSSELVKVSKASLLALVASNIKGKSLFPKKVAAAKEMLEHARLVKK